MLTAGKGSYSRDSYGNEFEEPGYEVVATISKKSEDGTAVVDCGTGAEMFSGWHAEFWIECDENWAVVPARPVWLGPKPKREVPLGASCIQDDQPEVSRHKSVEFRSQL